MNNASTLGWKKLLLPTLIALIAFVILLRLGMWQLERAEQKQSRIDNISAMQQKGVLGLSQVLASDGELSDIDVFLEGYFEKDKLFYWDNRIVEGRVGYEVLIPMTTNFGTVLVNLGWIPLGDNRDVLPKITINDGNTRLEGAVWIPSQNRFSKETASMDSGWPLVIQNADLEFISAALGKSILPFAVALKLPYDAQFKPNYMPVVMPPEKHIGYAIQWFGLALALLVIFVVATYKQLKKEE